MQLPTLLKRPSDLSLIIIALSACARLILANSQLLSFDEAYYWTWSQNIDYWYYDQGPVIAWLIRLATLFSSTVLSVKLVAIFCSSVFLYFGNRLVSETTNARTGLLWLVIIMSTPLSIIGGSISTYDTPMLMFWSAACYFAYQAIQSGRTKYWLIAGVLSGLGVLSKLPTIALPVGIFLTCLATPEGRRKLASPSPWIAGLIALMPLLLLKYWDDNHGNLFTLHSASLSKRHTNAQFGRWTADLIAGQLIVLGPTTFFGMIWALIQHRKVENQTFKIFTWMMCLPLLVVCFGLSTKSKLEVNWPIAAYFTGIIPLAMLVQRSRRPSQFIALLVVPGWIVSSVAGFPDALQFIGVRLKPEVAIKLYETYGWEILNSRLSATAKDVVQRGGFIAATNYRMTAMTAWMLKSTQNVECLFAHTRHNQFALWTKLEQRQGQDAIVVLDDVDSKDLSYIQKYFDSITEIGDPIVVTSPAVNGPIRTIHLYECKNFHSYQIKDEAIGY